MGRPSEPERSSEEPANPSPAVPDPAGAPFGAKVWEVTLRTVTGLLRAFEEDMKSEGFPLLWYDVLIQLDQAPERRLRMQDLAHAVILSRSGLTRLIDRMEEAGLVRRETAADDRRGAYAVLTREGRATYRRLAPGHREKIAQRFSDRLSDADLKALHRAMLKLAVVDEADPDGPDGGGNAGAA